MTEENKEDTSISVNVLNKTEEEAYRKYEIADGRSLDDAQLAEFFALYLNGYNCESIQTSNPDVDLGAIVKARVELDWDERKKRYLDGLMANVQDNVARATLESIRFAVDGLSVFHALVGKKFKKYLQTGDEKDLGTYAGMGLKQYREIMEVLAKLTAKTQQPQSIEVTHKIADSREKEIYGEKVTVKPDNHESLLRYLAEQVQEKK